MILDKSKSHRGTVSVVLAAVALLVFYVLSPILLGLLIQTLLAIGIPIESLEPFLVACNLAFFPLQWLADKVPAVAHFYEILIDAVSWLV